MKIGFFADIGHAEAGGVSTYQGEIVSALIEFAGCSDHRFVIISSNGRPPTKNNSLPTNIEFVDLQLNVKRRLQSAFITIISTMWKKFRYPFRRHVFGDPFSWIVRKKLANHRLDLLWYKEQHCPYRDLPYIVTLMDLDHRVLPYFPEVSTEGQWENREVFFSTALRRAAFVVVGTECGKSEIERFYQVPSEKIKVLPLPTRRFALDNFEKEISLPGRYCSSVPYLFYPAQFWPHKNHICLLLALKSLREKHGMIFQLLLAGSDKGNRRYIKQKVSELNLTEQVRFLGFVPEQELLALYKHAFALTFATFFGPDNLPPLEAFALGCPVIASRVAGAEEQLGDAALFFDPKNSEQLVDKIKMLYENPILRMELIQRGRKRALHFTAKDYIENIFALLDEFEPVRRCWSSNEPYHQLS